MPNPVLGSTIIKNPRYVFIQPEKIEDEAKRLACRDMPLPTWNSPVFIEGYGPEAIDFLLLGNTLNFAFTHFADGRKYTAKYNGIEYSGSYAMWASLKQAIKSGIPLLDGRFLQQLSSSDISQIFGDIPLPQERHLILLETGDILTRNYDGHFHNLVAGCGTLFSHGLVDRLTTEFQSFDDSAYYLGREVRFDKRAQLAGAAIHERLGYHGFAAFPDAGELTVFADYELPKALRAMGILRYEQSLADRVDNQKPIIAGSPEEVEIRAGTVQAAKMLQERINAMRQGPINAMQLDYKLWSEGKKYPGYHHLTETIFY